MIVSDSQLRMVDENELTADVVTIPEEKLGNIANSLNWSKKLAKYRCHHRYHWRHKQHAT